MILCDVNIFVYAHREDAPDHKRYLAFLKQHLSASVPFGVSELVLSSFLRVVTHPRVFNPPSPLENALEFAEQVMHAPASVLVKPQERHWQIFCELCRNSGARGNLVPDAYLAALAIESGSTWISTDRDYSRFAGLDWHHPFEL